MTFNPLVEGVIAEDKKRVLAAFAEHPDQPTRNRKVGEELFAQGICDREIVWTARSDTRTGLSGIHTQYPLSYGGRIWVRALEHMGRLGANYTQLRLF